MKKTSLYIVIALIAAISAVIWYRAEKTITPEPTLDTIIVGTNAEFQPFSFKHNDQIVGFDIDVIQEVFKRLGKQITLKDMPFDALIPEIQIGNIHVIAAGITPTEERAQRALFTHPHLTGNPLVIISSKKTSLDSEGQALTKLEDLAGKTVVVNEGYLSDSFMSEQPGVELLRLSSPLVSDGMLALQSSRADAFVTASHSIKPYFEKYSIDDFNVIPIPNTQETSAFAISKHYPDLRRDIQVTLNDVEKDGTLAAIKTKWNLL
ncbi:MAG TPA: transporter substrate-binding domain-containing protein [Candidatus Babeliales bacterium]|nr:transporter substrate-binding domain-containing protein [Candidatus Babeliales bacterium]